MPPVEPLGTVEQRRRTVPLRLAAIVLAFAALFFLTATPYADPSASAPCERTPLAEVLKGRSTVSFVDVDGTRRTSPNRCLEPAKTYSAVGGLLGAAALGALGASVRRVPRRTAG